MRGVAQISFVGGGMFLPSRTPYEREMVFEHAESCARRHGRAQLALNNLQFLVSSGNDAADICAECQQALRPVTFAKGSHRLCRYCARTSR